MADVAPIAPKNELYAGHLSVIGIFKANLIKAQLLKGFIPLENK